MGTSEIELGATYRDRIGGVAGVAIGYVTYITGCNQALIQPRSGDGCKQHDSHWIDETRLERLDDDTVTLDLAAGPGFDREPPKR